MISIAHASAAAGEAKAGLPQFDSNYFASQGFWAIVSFVILMWLLMKYVIPAINDILDARGKSIEGEIGKAKEQRQEADQILAEYKQKLKDATHEATQTIEDARKDAQRMADQAKAELDVELAKKRAAAEASIEQAKRQAIDEVKNVAVDLAMAATEKLVAKSVTKTDANKMVTETISQIKNQDINVH